MSKLNSKLFVMLIVVLMILPITSLSVPKAEATTVGKIGATDTTLEGYPKLGTLPAGVTPAYTIQTVAYLSMRPNPVGVGQSVLVNVWTSPGTYHAFPMEGNIVDIKKPDGTTMTVGPFNTYVGDATAWFEIIPDQVGTWQFKFRMVGTYIPAGQYWDLPGSQTGGFGASGKYFNLGASIYYTASETEWQNLTVQDNLVSSWPNRPMTTDYWTRPINPMWRDWGASLGDYWSSSAEYYWPNGRVLYASNYKSHAYVTAPNSAHVVWKRTLPTTGIAGMIGGYSWDYSLTASAGTPSIIFAGRCYQTVTKIFENLTQASVFQCYDLRTGQIYWERILQGPTPTSIEYAPGTATSTIGNEADVAPWSISLIAISGSQLYKYSPGTGAMSSNISISPASGGTIFANGMVYWVQNLGTTVPADQRYRLIKWSTYGSSTNFTTRILSNITFAGTSLPGVADYEAGLAGSCSWATPPGPQWCIGVNITMFDLNSGRRLWSYMTNDTITENTQSGSSFVIDRGKCAFGAHGRHWTCFDGRTGTRLWTSEQTEYPWGAWWPYNTASVDINETCGAIIAVTYEGVYAINWDDGKILWHFTDHNAVPFEGPYGATPFFTGVTIADGKVFAYNGEHTASYPRDRGWSMYVVNATTGELVWKIHNPMVPGAMADGYLTASNSYDGFMYVFGKGISATTVTAPNIAAPKGTGLVISGSVLDLSPAQPNTPCVSKDSMTLQMEIIHMQMLQAGLWGNETLTGVPVTLTAIDENGNVIDIGTTTSNGYYGNFGYTWTPPNEGQYTVMASFAGDDSYGSSAAACTVSVGPPPATPAPTVTAVAPISASDITNSLMTYLVAGVVAIIIAIAIVGALILRKR